MSAKLFTDFGLSTETLKAIARLGFEQPAPIQAEAIPPLMEGKDLVGQSQTGSGKTAAFAIPALERVDPAIRAVQVLILCPTRELAVQVSEEVHKLLFFRPSVRALPIYGGQSYERQFAGLKAGAQIVIGTPGRVMDHMDRKSLVLDQVKVVILDEADEMLNMGFRDDIEFILKAVPPTRQTVLFSATVPRPIEALIQHHTKNAVRIRIVSKALTVPTVEQVYFEVDRNWKIEALTRLIELHDVTLGIIFCNTQRLVDDLTEHLHAAGYSADAIHGGMAQPARDRVMKKFKTGGLEFLVATDVAARGLDVENVQVVFNFDLPYDPEDYVHRIGRTGRAGRSGLAISFVSGREVFAIRHIENYIGQRLRRGNVPSAGEIEEARMGQLIQEVRGTLKAGNFRHYDHVIEALLEEGFDSVDVASALFHKLHGADEGAKPIPTKKTMNGPTGKPAEETPIIPVRTVTTKPSPPLPKTLPTPLKAPSAKAPVNASEPGTAGNVVIKNVISSPKPLREPNAIPGAIPQVVQEIAPDLTPAVVASPKVKVPARITNDPKRKDLSVAPPPQRPAPQAGSLPAIPPGVAPSKPVEEPPTVRSPHSPPPAPDSTRLWLSAGTAHGIGVEDVRKCIVNETSLPEAVIRRVELRERHTFVDVPAVNALEIIAKLKRAQLGSRRLKAKVA